VHERAGEAVGSGAGGQAGRVPDRPLRALLGLPSFRRFLLAQALSALVNGTLRFVLVWITLDLTDWTPAVGLVGLALGLSGLVVAVPAGAWSDRVDRRVMFVRLSGVTAAVLASATVTIAAGVGGVALLAVHAAVLGGLLAAVAPGVQAMVPALVPIDRLMNGVALQMISMNVAMMLGAVSGGAAIALGGNAGGLGLLAVCAGAAAVSMARVELPVRIASTAPARLRTQIAEGLR
jgi:MFS family permease